MPERGAALRAALLAGAVFLAGAPAACAPPPEAVAPEASASDDQETRQSPPSRPAPEPKSPAEPAQDGPPVQLRAVVLADYPHDPRAYTQGLEWFEGRLYESTGLYGRSSVREVDLYTGEVLRRRELPDYLFGEGLARVGDQLVQLTWKAGLGRVLGLGDFEERRQFRYSGEGWGLCFDGERLVMSDGTAELRFLDAETFAELGRVEVHVEGHPLRNVNELECVGGQVYANLLGADALVRIDPTSGRVTALIEASGLLQGSDTAGSEVLNGIAYNPRDEVFYLTGKLWPRLFEVRFEPAD